MESKDNLFPIPENTVSWLLASQTPSIRYFTLTKIIQKALDDPLVLKTRSAIANSAYIKTIFSDQSEEGYWYNARHFYGPKYRSSHWAMYLLTELGLSPNNSNMQKGTAFMIRRIEEYETKFKNFPSVFGEARGVSCFWGNWLRYQIYCGNLKHPLVQHVINYVCEDINRKGICDYNADLPCAWGVVRGLHGLALIPHDKRSQKTRNAIKNGIAFILDEHGNKLINGSYPTPGKIHPTWKQLSFPLFYQVDVLFTLRVFAELNALNHIGTRKALELIASRQNKNGRWRGASPYKSRTHPFLIPPDTPSHWVTLHALSVLSAANRQAAG